MNIKAKFIGADGSLGYRTGTTYFLQVKEMALSGAPHIVNCIPYAGRCPYSSWNAFWQNWQQV